MTPASTPPAEDKHGHRIDAKGARVYDERCSICQEEALKELTAAIVKAVPDIRVYHDRCMNCGYGFDYCKKLPATHWGRPACRANESYEDRSITLEDVLRTVCDKEQIGEAYTLSDYPSIRNVSDFWKLSQPLHLQPEPTIRFLHSLLCRP